MNRVKTLIEQLQQQMDSGAGVEQLLLTVQMIQAELMHIRSSGPDELSSAVKIDMPVFMPEKLASKQERNSDKNEKIVEMLVVDDAEIEAELEEIKKNVEAINMLSSLAKPTISFDPVEDTPTLVHQRNESIKFTEIIDHLPGDIAPTQQPQQIKTELSDSSKETAIKDLKKAIGVNDRLLFIKDLFRGDETMYERSIKTINGFSILPEAEFWIRRELKVKLGWNDTNPVVKQFDYLVKRRFA